MSSEFVKMIRDELKKQPVAFFLVTFPAGIMGVCFGVFALLTSQFKASLTPEEFAVMTPERVVEQKIFNLRGGRPSYYLRTESGAVFKRGIYSPYFQEIREAIERGRTLNVWYGSRHPISEVLKGIVPPDPIPIYQIATETTVLLSYDRMMVDYHEKAQMGYFLFLFAPAGIFLIFVSSWGLMLKK